MEQPNHQPPAGLATSAEIEDETLTEGEVQVVAAILHRERDRDGTDLAREVLLAATWVRGHPERVEEAIARTSAAANPWRACSGVLAGAIALTAIIWGLLTHRLTELVDHFAYPRLGWVLLGAVGVMALDAWVDDLGTCWHTIRRHHHRRRHGHRDGLAALSPDSDTSTTTTTSTETGTETRLGVRGGGSR